MKRILSIMLCVIVLFSLAACGEKIAIEKKSEIPSEEQKTAENVSVEAKETPQRPQQEGEVKLRFAQDYSELLAYLNTFSATRVRAGGVVVEAVEAEVMEEAAAIDTAAVRSASNSETGVDYSKTNVQVKGIDEGDIVKTDGEYIYLLRDYILHILKADGAGTRLVSSTQLGDSYNEESKSDNGNYSYCYEDKYPQEIYIHGDKLAVISNYTQYSEGCDDSGWYYEDTSYTALDIYDISDPAIPTETASLGQDGYDLCSRMMDGKLYLVTLYSVYNWDEDEPLTYVPKTYKNDEVMPMAAEKICICPDYCGTRYALVCSYDLESGALEYSQSILGGGNKLYMSQNSIYLADSYRGVDESEPRTESFYTVIDCYEYSRTDIYRFDLSAGLELSAMGTVPGYLNNQFSMDEHNGYLRLVTTSDSSSIDSDRNLIAFPGDGDYYIYSYSTETGFNVLAHISFENYDYNLRGLYVGDALYVLGRSSVKVIDIHSFELMCELVF